MLGSHILYLKGLRIIMFQLSGFYYRKYREENPKPPAALEDTPLGKQVLSRVINTKPGPKP